MVQSSYWYCRKFEINYNDSLVMFYDMTYELQREILLSLF